MTAVIFAAFGSGSLMGWDAPAHLAFNGASVQAALGALLAQPALWCVAASWLVAALALALVRLRPTRAFAVVGAACAGAVLMAGICAAAWVASSGLTWLPSVHNLTATLIPIALMLATCVLVPDYAYSGETS